MGKKAVSAVPETVIEEQSPMDRWVGRNLRRANNALFSDFIERFSSFDIRPALFSVLAVIERRPGSSGAKLSELLAIPPANMVLTLRELEHRGLIVRKPDPKNGRARITFLSKAGEKLMPKLHAVHAEHENILNALMSPAEQDTLVELLQRIWKDRPVAADESPR